MTPKTVYIVMVNADFTEGRGPMVYHSCWSTLDLAQTFVQNQTGVQGRKQTRTTSFNNDETRYDDYTIKHVTVNTEFDPEAKKKAKENVDKLKQQLKEAEDTLHKFG